MQDPKIMNNFKEMTFADINKATVNMNSGTVRAYTRIANLPSLDTIPAERSRSNHKAHPLGKKLGEENSIFFNGITRSLLTTL